MAVSKILRLSASETTHAIGIAATQVVGLREMFGSHTKSFHPGRAAQCGLVAAVLAQGGYTSSEKALEAKRGWANVVGATKADIQEDLETFVGSGVGGETALSLPSGGEGRWEILRNSFKPFPCGIVIHPVIDACAQLHDEMVAKGLDVRSIKSVKLKVHPLVLELTGKRTPKDGLEAKFSVFHSGACGLLFGKATPAEYDERVVQDDEVVAVRDRIDAEIDASLSPDQAVVSVTLDAETLEKHVAHAIGSLEVPMDDAMLERKFIDQCLRVLGSEAAQSASEACWNIETLDDVSAITSVL